MKDLQPKDAFNLMFDIVSRVDPYINRYRTQFYNLFCTCQKWAQSESNQGIKRMRTIMTMAKSYALGSEFEKGVPYLAIDKSTQLPSILWPILPALSRAGEGPNAPRNLSVIITLCNFPDCFDGSPSDSDILKQISTIQTPKSPNTGDFIRGEGAFKDGGFKDFIKRFKETFPRHPVVNYLNKPFPIRGGSESEMIGRFKAGPNGRVALAASDKDLVAIVNEEVGANLFFLQRNLLSGTTWSPDKDLVYALEHVDEYHYNPGYVSGKLAVLPEKAGKLRIIAQADNWSQSTMSHVHEWLMSSLTGFPMDCTFDQKKHFPLLEKWTSTDRAYMASFDQSSCTDLFPVEVQIEILSQFKTDSFAESVRQVLVERDFHVSLPSGKKERVRWTTGQPMGIMGSWPLMAIAHHFIIQYCASKALGDSYWNSRTLFNRYMVLGDDVVISHGKVAEHYLKLCQSLGMKINLSKSHVSKPGKPSLAEFAKCIVWRGKVLTPVPWRMVKTSLKDDRYALPLLSFLCDNPLMTFHGEKSLKWLITKYFSKSAKVLEPLIHIPRFLGGLGLKSSYLDLTRCENGISPILLYLAVKSSKIYNKKGGLLRDILSERQMSSGLRDYLSQQPAQLNTDTTAWHTQLSNLLIGDSESVQSLAEATLKEPEPWNPNPDLPSVETFGIWSKAFKLHRKVKLVKGRSPSIFLSSSINLMVPGLSAPLWSGDEYEFRNLHDRILREVIGLTPVMVSKPN